MPTRIPRVSLSRDRRSRRTDEPPRILLALCALVPKQLYPHSHGFRAEGHLPDVARDARDARAQEVQPQYVRSIACVYDCGNWRRKRSDFRSRATNSDDFQRFRNNPAIWTVRIRLSSNFGGVRPLKVNDYRYCSSSLFSSREGESDGVMLTERLGSLYAIFSISKLLIMEKHTAIVWYSTKPCRLGENSGKPAVAGDV